MFTAQPAQFHVISDHPLYRAALVRVLDETAGVCIGVTAGSVEEFAAYRRPGGATVVVDPALPGAHGAAAVAALIAQGFRVLVISASRERSEVLAAIAAGAHAYLTKQADVDEIRRAVREVVAGHRYVSPGLAAYLLDASVARPLPCQQSLSGREREVLALLAAGERDQDIAQALRISIRTVRSHLDRIRDKTGQRRRPDLTRLAIEKGLCYEPQRRDALPVAS